MDVDALLRQLVQGDEDARVAAAAALGESGDRRALGGLVHALRDVDAEVRAQACEALGGLEDARAVPPLVSLLRDADEGVRGEAFSALLRIGQARASSLPDYRGEDPRSPSLALTQIVWPADLEAVRLLHEALDDPDPEVRIGCAYALGRMGVAGAFDSLYRLLHMDADPEVRAAAAFSLGDLHHAGEARAVPALIAFWPQAQRDDEQAVVVVRALAESGQPAAWPVLLAALEHRDDRVRQLAVMGLAETRVPHAVAHLAPRLRDPHVGVRRNAAHALGRQGDAAAVEALIAAVPENDAEVRSAVGEALARLDPGAVQAGLARAAAGDAELRQAAAYLRGQLHHTEGLVEALADPEPLVRKAAALALGGSAAPRFRAALEAALADDHWRVRVAAAEGLRRMADPAAIPALRRHVRDEHPVVENAVGFALRSLEGRTG